MIGELLDRNPPAVVAVALYGALVASLVAWAALAVARRGAPGRWSAAQAYGFIALSLIGSLGWWWVDAPVEGPVTWVLSNRHGVTHGDLLALPALAAGGAVLAARLLRRGAPSRE